MKGTISGFLFPQLAFSSENSGLRWIIEKHLIFRKSIQDDILLDNHSPEANIPLNESLNFRHWVELYKIMKIDNFLLQMVDA